MHLLENMNEDHYKECNEQNKQQLQNTKETQKYNRLHVQTDSPVRGRQHTRQYNQDNTHNYHTKYPVRGI